MNTVVNLDDLDIRFSTWAQATCFVVIAIARQKAMSPRRA